jgi:nucleoside 2-deoxyribosyltransferase/sugar/nucleoside kinase (ribokinase family)
MQDSQMNLRLLIIGEVFTDLYLHALPDDKKHLIRLGGIFHAARACHAATIEYGIGYYAPSYLNHDISRIASELNAKECYNLGVIERKPNVMIVSEVTEAGDQGYFDVLYNQKDLNYTNPLSKLVSDFQPTDVLVFPGIYDVEAVIAELTIYKCRLHVDINYDSESFIKQLSFKLTTVIISTSSSIFGKTCNGNYNALKSYLNIDICENILLKENRGGSKLFCHRDNIEFNCPAFPTNTVHSVGVGDCFNVMYLSSLIKHNNPEIALRWASLCSSHYASTFSHDIFVLQVKNTASMSAEIINNIHGVRLSWESRSEKHIYIAAPDFPDVDTTLITQVAQSLQYHNFKPHLPVRENGIITGVEDVSMQDSVYEKDYNLLKECNLLIAVLLYDDPGTLVELGIFAQMGKPTILFDPYCRAKNLFLRKTATRICNTVGEVIDETYDLLRER